MNKPTIVMVFAKERQPTSTKYGGFAARLKKQSNFPDATTLTVALENLVYKIDETGGAKVYDAPSGFDLGDASFVYLKGWQSMPNEAAALAHYLHGKGVGFADTLALGKGTSKLVTLFRQWAAGLRVPATLYSASMAPVLAELRSGYLGERFIMKDTEGAKGQLNFRVDAMGAKEIFELHPDVSFVFQRFIPNSGDYRIGVYGEEPRFVLHRKGSGEGHLNNTSAGGVGTYVPVEKAPKSALALAKRAARASELQVAGVDVIQDSETKRWYVLEVNQGSQIVTGAFTEENMRAFNEALESQLRSRIARTRMRSRKVIGRRAIAKFPELGVDAVVAKIDTGAYSSTLHAEDISVLDGELRFSIVPSDRLRTSTNKTVEIATRDFFTQKVRSSNGHVQERYSIRTKISLDGIRFSAILTLSDRSQMGYPLLVGRKLLRSRFLVNVELDENNEASWKY